MDGAEPLSKDGILYDVLANPVRSVFEDMIFLDQGDVGATLAVLREPHRVTAETARPIFYAIFGVLSPVLYSELVLERDTAALAVAAFRELRYIAAVLNLPVLTISSLDKPRPLEFAQQLNGIVDFLQYLMSEKEQDSSGQFDDENQTLMEIQQLTEKYAALSTDVSELENRLYGNDSERGHKLVLRDLQEQKLRLDSVIENLASVVQQNLYPRAQQANERALRAQQLCVSEEHQLEKLQTELDQRERELLLLRKLADGLDGLDGDTSLDLKARIELKLHDLDKQNSSVAEAERQGALAVERASTLIKVLDDAIQRVWSASQRNKEAAERLAALEPEVESLQRQQTDIIIRISELSNKKEMLESTLTEQAEKLRLLDSSLHNDNSNHNNNDSSAEAEDERLVQLTELQRQVRVLESTKSDLGSKIQETQQKYVNDSELFERLSLLVTELSGQLSQIKKLYTDEVAAIEKMAESFATVDEHDSD